MVRIRAGHRSPPADPGQRDEQPRPHTGESPVFQMCYGRLKRGFRQSVFSIRHHRVTNGGEQAEGGGNEIRSPDENEEMQT